MANFQALLLLGVVLGSALHLAEPRVITNSAKKRQSVTNDIQMVASESSTINDQQPTARACTPNALLKQQCEAELTNYDTTADWIADPDRADLRWIEKCIANYYCFKKKQGADEWTSIPTLADALGTDYMEKAAERAKQFFVRNNDWDDSKSKFKVNNQCTNLLYVTAARYLLVTQVLYEVSEGSLTVCERDPNGKTRIPAKVCFPPNYGSQTCTSDYDVGLVGPESGNIAALFNEYFQDAEKGFGKPSEEVFDTNIYAYTLEFAMPNIYSGLTPEFLDGVNSREGMPNYKMQEVASAIFKVYKYKQEFGEQLLNSAKAHLPKTWSKQLNDWYKLFLIWSNNVENAIRTDQSENFRERHNKIYQMLVGSVAEASRDVGLPAEHMAQVSLALIYAAEAYHTRGAIRHVVGVTQMKNQDIENSLTLWDFWTSMLENWGDSIKEHHHCTSDNINVEACLVKMSKYLWRLFLAMDKIKGLLGSDASTLMDIKPAHDLMSHWLYDLKKKGAGSIPATERIDLSAPAKDYLPVFLGFFQCSNDRRGQKLSEKCMEKIQNKVNTFHVTLALQIKAGKLHATPAS
ncbi:predicted protein [Nematostella vectensis]|uniref:Uncharacterized protein n=1 Tax=Nematostella vectensis TaxID=45351 RepID=A7T3E2_NEMVE|nr:predicted protein [Nematostella vectensis]|eukprot:XP_001621624.1 hypothetical protein NEMVEDRAFT_v1g248659 [Nematostella vectensis]